jgi:hypothetical protein
MGESIHSRIWAVAPSKSRPFLATSSSRMNIAISRAFGVLRLVGARGEMEKEEILKKVEN